MRLDTPPHLLPDPVRAACAEPGRYGEDIAVVLKL